MKNFSHKQLFQTILLFLLITFCGLFYSQTVLYLPLFGDVTSHGFHAKTIVTHGWTALNADYPPFYYYSMAILEAFFGEKGYNLVPFTGFILLLFATFLLIRQVTKNYYLSLLAIIFVACSPKIIFYSARMYQEILLSALIIFSIYFFLRYIETREKYIVWILAFFVGITLSLKQQGLFLLYTSISFFFIIDWIRRKTKFTNLLIVLFIPLLIGLPFYGMLYHTKGELQPGSGEFSLFRIINTVGQKIFLYEEKPDIDDTLANSELENELQRIEKEHISTGHSRAEERHVWPTDVFTNFEKFNQANNLFVNIQGKTIESPSIMYAFFVLIIAGFLYCFFRFRVYFDLILFSSIFLTLNYLSFARNTDQQRYHMFIPIFLLCFVFIILNQITQRVDISPKIKILFIVLALSIAFLPILSPRIQLNKLWINSQLYSSSKGGITSVKEAGSWLAVNTPNNAIVGQQCGNETSYYADRIVQGDWRVYFLKKDDLKEYFKRTKTDYYVVFASQVVDDNKWFSLCWVPNSFWHRMEKTFPKVYTTKANDIYIYETK